MPIPKASETAFWDKFTKPLKEAMWKQPSTFKELLDIVRRKTKNYALAYLQNSLAYLSLNGQVEYNYDTKLWRMKHLAPAKKPKREASEDTSPG